jgi:heavy metal sensor kinase
MKHWWQRRTLRFRLAAWYSIGGTVLLAAFSATLYAYVSYRMALPLDYALRRDLAEVKRNLQVRSDGTILWNGAVFPAGVQWPASNPWFELWDENGQLVRRYWPFVDSRLAQLPLPPARGRETISVFHVAPDIRVRVLSVPLDIEGPQGEWMIRVLSIHEPALNALRELLIIIAIALPVVVILLVLGGYALTRRWLMPLDSMVREANRITASDLSRRLPVVNPDDELGRLAQVFNTTLSRLEDSFAALDRFVADASHELLTPLTTLRSVGEVGLRGNRTAEQYRDMVGSMLEETQRLQLLVEKLLQLARAEGGAKIVELAPVRLDELAHQCAEDASILAEEKNQRIIVQSAPLEIVTDALLLRQALQNLIDNAIKYSPAKAAIRLAVELRDDAVVLSVADNGPGIPEDQRARLMDRFFRADNARKRDGGGFGLGLAITKAYMGVLGGTVSYEPVQSGGSVFSLKLPVSRRVGASTPFLGPISTALPFDSGPRPREGAAI